MNNGRAAESATSQDAEAGLLIAFGGNNQSGPIDVATAQTAHGGSGRFDFESETFIAFSSKDHGADAMENVAPTLRAMNFDGSHANAGGQIAVAHSLRAEGFDASEDGTGRGISLVPVSVALRGREEGATAELTGNVMTALRCGGGGGDKPHVLLPFDTTQISSGENRCNPQPGDPCHPIPAHGHAPAIASHNDEWRVRRLMPVECERLQGFPDGYTDVPYRRRNATPDGPRYKALGNSKAVNCVRWLGMRIAEVDAIGARGAA